MEWRTPFTELIGCRYPLQQAGIGEVATPRLAMAVAEAGGLGMLSGVNGRADLERQFAGMPADAVVGVNFLMPFLDRGALELAAERVGYVEMFWGEPDPRLIEVGHAGGAKVGWQVGSVREASAAVDAGCDVVVAQGIEAGGHVRGTVGVLALLAEVRPQVRVPLVAAGGIGTGAGMAAVLAAGADGARIGTRFVAAHEAGAHPGYVDALSEATADDTVLTTAFGTGWPDAPHRVLRSAVTAGERRGDQQAWTPNWPQVGDVEVEAMALYAGQGVDAVRGAQSAADIVSELVDGAQREVARIIANQR